MNQPKVIRVRGEAIYMLTPRRSAACLPPDLVGYRYFAVLGDGSEERIRTRAAQHYAWAYQWADPVVSRKQADLASHFTYSSSGGDPATRHALREFRIEWSAPDVAP
jgi:hypothetical protein